MNYRKQFITLYLLYHALLKMSRLSLQLFFMLFGFGLLELAHCIPKPNDVFDLVQRNEYLGFGEWVDDEDFPLDDMSSVLVDKQIQLRCFQELRHDKSRNFNRSDGFYLTTADKFDVLYGTWRIRAKLPSKVQEMVLISLVNSRCRPPMCPRYVPPPSATLGMDQNRTSDLKFMTMYMKDGEEAADFKHARKLPKYGDSFHTYEIIWTPDRLEWRIDGRVVAGFFDPEVVPQDRMALYLSAYCDHGGRQVFNEDSGFTISSIVYTPLASPITDRLLPTTSTTEEPTRRTTAVPFGARSTARRSTRASTTRWEDESSTGTATTSSLYAQFGGLDNILKIGGQSDHERDQMKEILDGIAPVKIPLFQH